MKLNGVVILAVLGLCLAATPVSAKGNGANIEGEVVVFEQGVPVGNQGEFDQVTLRTRDGATRRLLMGETNGCHDCIAVGDQVRARVVRGGSEAEPERVQTMKVRRTGETLAFRNESGELLRTTTRSRDRARVDSGTGGGRHGNHGGGGGRHR